MKLDEKLTLEISNQQASYNQRTSTFSRMLATVTRYRKNGYMAFDNEGNNICIVYISDDIRATRYGNAEILFFKEYQQQYGTWRIIKIHGQYLPYSDLEEILKRDGKYILTTDERQRR